MKKIITLIVAMVAVSFTSFAQVYVGSSTSTTDYFGNRTTVHRDSYGRTPVLPLLLPIISATLQLRIAMPTAALSGLPPLLPTISATPRRPIVILTGIPPAPLP